MEKPEIAHLAGFFDADGDIFVKITNDDRFSIGYNMQAGLRISRRNEDDPIFGMLMEYCEENGVIKYNISERQNSIVWITKNKEDIKRFLSPMREYFVSSYERAELMTGVIIPSLEDGKHTEKETFYELVGVVDQMRKGKRSLSVKYDQEYFAEEWSVLE